MINETCTHKLVALCIHNINNSINFKLFAKEKRYVTFYGNYMFCM